MAVHILTRPLTFVLPFILALVVTAGCSSSPLQALAALTTKDSPTATRPAPTPPSTPRATTFTPDASTTPVATTTTGAAAVPTTSAPSIRAIATSETPIVIGASAANPTEQAIQTVVLNNNLNQAKALSSGDPSVMKGNATSSFYQKMVQSNQQLASAGATSVQLIKLVWGPISVQGTTARATTYETWLSSYSDGSTELLVNDRNVYDLAESNSKWLIQADNHPNSQGPTGSGPAAHLPTPAPVGTPLPTVGPSANMSRNWAGYNATGGQFTEVTGTWLVPLVDAQNAGQTAANSTWVGIGGINSRDLIQAGSEAIVGGPGDTVYSTWIELIPAAPTTVPLSVLPGDSLAVAIDETQPGTWSISLKNNTSGKSYQTTVQYHSSNSSAEWVEEAASTGRHGIAPLDNFGVVRFTDASTVERGHPVDLSQAGATPITLEGPGGQPLAVPSRLGSGGTSFEVRRT